MSRRVAFRGKWYWFDLGLRSGFIEFGRKRLVWWLFIVQNEPRRVEPSEPGGGAGET